MKHFIHESQPQLLLDSTRDLSVPLKDCLDEQNATALDLGIIFRKHMISLEMVTSVLPYAPGLLDVNSLYVIQPDTCRVVQVRNTKKGNKLQFFWDPEKDTDEDMGQTGARDVEENPINLIPLKPLSPHILDTTPRALQFYNYKNNSADNDNHNASADNDHLIKAGKVLFCKEKELLVTEEASLRKFYLKILVRHENSGEHFGLSLTHAIVCKVRCAY